MRLDAHAARAAIEAHVARPAGLDPIRAAWGVHEIANEDVARAFRIHASERGFDYRRSSMVTFARAAYLDDYPDPEPDDIRACTAYAHAVISRDTLSAVTVAER